MQVELSKTFRFEAAHHLPHVPADHQCRRPHGHSYRVTVHVKGEVDPNLGWVMDYADISAVVKPLIEELDHYDLNTIEGLENPTCEHLCFWLWSRLEAVLPELSALEVSETQGNNCVLRRS